jgi:type II secretory pathway pseudopilin PulG
MFSGKYKIHFTIMEILVIVGIILGLILLVSLIFNEQMAKARDDKRISDINAIRTALEFYYSDANEYPIIEQAIVLGSSQAKKLCSKDEGGFVASSVSCKSETEYLSVIPTDPLTSGQFIYQGKYNGYDLSFTTESGSELGAAGQYHGHAKGIDSQAGIR